MSAVILHLDVNSFYASCEQAFRPELRGKPVVVLSNNDGTIIALTRQAKALGLRRGMPYFKVRSLIAERGAAVFSSNYELYQAVSDRIIEAMTDLVPVVERYSIDEVFADLSGVAGDPADTGRALRERLWKWLRMPSCVGIGPTKTLAKLCDHFAKTYPAFGGVLDWAALSRTRRERALIAAPLREIWGIGARTAAGLEAMGARTALDFARLPGHVVRHRFGVAAARTREELLGRSCIPIEPSPPRPLQICRSRSFGVASANAADLEAALACHVEESAARLRAHGLLAGAMTVFFMSDVFRTDLPQDAAEILVRPRKPTADTLLLEALAIEAACARRRPGIRYKKAGIILSELESHEDDAPRQPSLFADDALCADDSRREALMRAVDGINARFGRGTLCCAATKLSDGWRMRRDHLSGCGLTRWEDIPQAW